MAINLKKIEDNFRQKVNEFAELKGIKPTTVFFNAGYENYTRANEFMQGECGMSIKVMIRVEQYIKSFKKD